MISCPDDRAGIRQIFPPFRSVSQTVPKAARTLSPPAPCHCATTLFVFASICVKGNSVSVAHTDPAPKAISPPCPGIPAAMVARSLPVLASTREIVPSPWFRTQIDPAPKARNRGFGPIGSRTHDFVCGRIHAYQLVAGIGTDPDRASRKQGIERPGGNADFRDDLIGRSVDPRQLAFGGGHQPNASGPCCNAAFGIRRSGRNGRLRRAGLSIDADDALVATARNPQAAKAHRQPGTGLMHGDCRSGPVGPGIEPNHAVGFLAGHPDCVDVAASQSGSPFTIIVAVLGSSAMACCTPGVRTPVFLGKAGACPATNSAVKTSRQSAR